MKTVEEAPVLQHRNIEKSFIGFNVKWPVRFYTFLKKNKNKAVLYTTDYGYVYPQIYFSIQLSDYPELKLIKSGEKIIVQGEITKVLGHEITLSKCKLEFSENQIDPEMLKDDDIKKDITTATYSDHKSESNKKSWQDNIFLYFVVGLGIVLVATLIIKICSDVYNFYF